MRILVTGGAGFIGYHLTDRLIAEGHEVSVLDNLNEYYDVSLKKARLKNLEQKRRFTFILADILDYSKLTSLLKERKIECVVHLAALAGVRYSLEHGDEYIRTNIEGTYTVFEAARRIGIGRVVYASSSSVYGAETRLPWTEDMPADKPVSLYGATKRACELIAYQYHHAFQISSVGLRLFTVYGPWGRPDMAYFLFSKGISGGTPINVYNNGRMKRDFTYVSDIVSGIVASISLKTDFEILNLGSGTQVELINFIGEIEKNFNRKADIHLMPMQQGDFVESHADITRAQKILGYAPRVTLAKGMKVFCDWYKSYYQIG